MIIGKSEAQQRKYTKSDEPPRKSSKIIVMVRDSGNTMLDKLTLTLFNYGYTVDNKDEKLRLLSTKERSSPKYSTLTKIRASVNDTAIVFTGVIALGFDIELFGARDLQPSYSSVYYGGAKKSPLREAWNELDAIARTFGDKIVYSK
jgi:hypothetical protein